MPNDQNRTREMLIYVCPKCGSRDIEIPMWVRVNETAIVGDYDEGSTNYDVWCPDCDEHHSRMVTLDDYDAEHSNA